MSDGITGIRFMPLSAGEIANFDSNEMVDRAAVR